MPHDDDGSDDDDGIEESYHVGLSEEMSFSLRVGGAYLIKEKKTEISMRILIRLLKMGMKGLIISGTIPKKLRSRYGLGEGEAEIIWLSTAGGRDEAYNPSRLEYEITDKISQFVKGGGKVILLDGLEILEYANSFEKVVEFVKTLSDFAAVYNGIFLLPVNPDVFKKEKLTTLEWQLEPLSVSDDGGAGVEIDESALRPESSAHITELENKVKNTRAERDKLEDDNRKLADGIISITRELENLQQILNAKEEEIIALKRERFETNAELRELRFSGIGRGESGEDARSQLKKLEAHIKTLDNEKASFEESLQKRDDEIKHLGAVIKEKDESLRKKQEMLKSLLAKVTDVEVRINAPAKAHASDERIASQKLEKDAKFKGQKCPTCGSAVTKVYGVGDQERVYCEKCKKWLKF